MKFNSLPLSWSTINSEKSNSYFIEKGKLKWIFLQELPESNFSNNFKNEFDNRNDIIIRGCNSSIKNSLSEKGYYSIKNGMEAILDTSKNHFRKKSLIELIKRGLRHGSVIKLPYSIINKNKLIEFQNKTSHSNEPQLKNLFQMEFKEDNLLYVFADNNNDWLGAVLLSKNNPDKLHTELILRKDNSPNGIMEALMFEIFRDAKQKQIGKLSLGEVPFVYNKISIKDYKSGLIFGLGKMLNFAYNYKGLYNFKNKFEPEWENTFICVSTKIKIKHILFLFFYSNFLKLIIYKIFNKINPLRNLKKGDTNINFINGQLDFNKT